VRLPPPLLRQAKASSIHHVYFKAVAAHLRRPSCCNALALAVKPLVSRLLIFAVLTAGVLVFHFSRQGREQRIVSAAREKILIAGNGAEVETLDPHLATGVPEHKIISSMFEGLVAPAPNNPDDIVPGAAASWEHENFTTWTFHLQPQGKWSDGRPLTAHDFVYSFQRILSPDLAGEYASMLFPLLNAEEFNAGKVKDFEQVGVKAIDDLTLQFKLTGPTPYLLGMMKHYTWFPVPKHVIEKFGSMTLRDSAWTKAENIVSNGPFRMKEWRFTHYLQVERNPFYWDASNVKLSGVRFMPIASDTTEERAFQDGQLHVTETLPLPRIPAYRAARALEYHADSVVSTYFYRFNTTKPPFNDPRVRRALAMSIDREAIVSKVLKGGQQPALGLTPPGCGVGYETPMPLRYDPETARQLLAQAGYPDGKGFPKFDILINSSEAHRTIAEAVQQMWQKQLHIPAGILNQDWAVYLDSMRKIQFDVCRAAWLGDYADPMTFLSIWRTGDGNNCTGWSNKRYDAMLIESCIEPDPKKRMALLHDAEAMMLDELPIVPVYWYVRSYLVQPQVKNWKPSVLEHRCYKALDL
jgi:oligopeptide transport system substrate-binding protein